MSLRSLALPGVLFVSVLFVGTLPAQATTYVIDRALSLGGDCEAPLPGTWNSGTDTCSLDGYTVAASDTLDIQPSTTVQMLTSFMNNGSITNSGLLLAFIFGGTAVNNGTITNSGTVYLTTNDGTVTNTVTGHLEFDTNNGTITNHGTIAITIQTVRVPLLVKVLPDRTETK